jgi:hypothetical protein
MRGYLRAVTQSFRNAAFTCLGTALVAAAVLIGASAGAASSPTAETAGCGSLGVDGKRFVFYKRGLTCKKAKGLARQTYRSNKPPRGWKCPDASPGNNRRDGAQCYKPGTKKSYGYHAYD